MDNRSHINRKQCNKLQHTGFNHYNTLQHNLLKHTTIHCNTLHLPATPCNLCNTLQRATLLREAPRRQQIPFGIGQIFCIIMRSQWRTFCFALLTMEKGRNGPRASITSVDHKGVTCYGLRGRGVESCSLMMSVETKDLSGEVDIFRVSSNTTPSPFGKEPLFQKFSSKL